MITLTVADILQAQFARSRLMKCCSTNCMSTNSVFAYMYVCVCVYMMLLQAVRSPLQWQRLPQGRKQSMVLSVVLHAVCLITTLVCATADAAITSRNGSSAAAVGSSVWADSALQDPQFIAKVSNRVTVVYCCCN
jgi:hypothetical protein